MDPGGQEKQRGSPATGLSLSLVTALFAKCRKHWWSTVLGIDSGTEDNDWANECMDLGMERRNVKPATIGSLVLVLRVATGDNCSERTEKDGRIQTVDSALNSMGWLLQATSSLGAPNQNFMLVPITNVARWDSALRRRALHLSRLQLPTVCAPRLRAPHEAEIFACSGPFRSPRFRR